MSTGTAKAPSSESVPTIDAVYLCRSGRNEELRFSLRSLRNLPIRNVWLVGGKPDWYTGDFLPVDQTGTKYQITERAMTAACEHAPISDRFVMFNDDFYVLEDGPLPAPMHRGPIADLIAWYFDQGHTPASSAYLAFMVRTLELLQQKGVPEPLSYELHIPMVVHKEGMLDATKDSGQQRSMYGNLQRIGGKYTEDVKVNRGDHRPEGRWLSSRDTTFPYLQSFLRSRFPQPSPWEAHK